MVGLWFDFTERNMQPCSLIDDLSEFFGLFQNLLCFSLGGNKRIIVINHGSLSPTSVEVITVRVSNFANRKLDHIERNPVVSSADDAIPPQMQSPFLQLVVLQCRRSRNVCLEQILRVVETNMLGAIRTTKAFIPHFRQKRAGLFINTTSIGGLMTVPFNSLYHATKWALEGWSESMAFELNQLGIGIKTIEPGGMKTDFFTRSLDTARHPAYDELVNRVMGIITDPKQMATYASPEQIAEIVFEAATDGKDQLRYVAGSDAKAMHEMRLQIGDEAFRKAMAQQFFGDASQAASTPR